MTRTNMAETSDISIIHLLHRAGQSADELFAAEAANQPLTPRQYEVLKAVAASSEEPSQTQLVEKTGIDRSTLADIVRRLVERKLLARKRTRRDARMYAVTITPEGQSVLRGIEPAAKATSERLLESLSAAERDALVDALKRIITAAKAIDNETG